jgi:hypothetical protein
MSAPSTRSTNPAIREVARGLATAEDKRILRVVAMVDAMAQRGAADQVIAPLRERLARLRPPRPLRFARLLFMPLDPLIVPPARWRLEQPAIPRSAIVTLAEQTRTALGALGQQIERMIEGRSTRDADVVEQAGALLWPRAAEVLLNAGPCAAWGATGLVRTVYRPLTRRIGALLAQADRIRRMVADAAVGIVPPEASDVLAVLRGAGELEAEAQPMVVALLLARIPESGEVIWRVAPTLGERARSMLRIAGDQAADMLLEQLTAPRGAEGLLGGQDLTEAGATVRRLIGLLGTLKTDNQTQERRDQLGEVHVRIRAACESLFAERLNTDLLEPLATHEANTDTAWMWDFETSARALRVLETEARNAGGDKTYDSLLGQAGDTIRAMIVSGTLDRSHGLRLLEIVVGPEAALELMEELA